MEYFSYYLTVVKDNYANFNGRARRSEYWYFYLFHIIIAMVLGGIGGALNIAWLAAVYYIALLVPFIAVGVRRMHDVGKSGWFLLIPLYNLILAVTEGNVGANEYGNDPKKNN